MSPRRPCPPRSRGLSAQITASHLRTLNPTRGRYRRRAEPAEWDPCRRRVGTRTGDPTRMDRLGGPASAGVGCCEGFDRDLEGEFAVLQARVALLEVTFGASCDARRSRPFGESIEGAEWLAWAGGSMLAGLPLVVAAVLCWLGVRRGGATMAWSGAMVGTILTLLLGVLPVFGSLRLGHQPRRRPAVRVLAARPVLASGGKVVETTLTVSCRRGAHPSVGQESDEEAVHLIR